MEPTEKPKRRLPVLKNDEVAAEGDEERPPWHWSAIGAVAIFVLWLPLAFLTAAIDKRLLGDADPNTISAGLRAVIAGVNLLGFMLAALGGGAIVGRFGGKAGLKEATIAGVATASLAWLTIALQGAGIVLLLLLIAAGAGASRLGGWLGLRGRVSDPRP